MIWPITRSLLESVDWSSATCLFLPSHTHFQISLMFNNFRLIWIFIGGRVEFDSVGIHNFDFNANNDPCRFDLPHFMCALNSEYIPIVVVNVISKLCIFLSSDIPFEICPLCASQKISNTKIFIRRKFNLIILFFLPGALKPKAHDKGS